MNLAPMPARLPTQPDGTALSRQPPSKAAVRHPCWRGSRGCFGERAAVSTSASAARPERARPRPSLGRSHSRESGRVAPCFPRIRVSGEVDHRPDGRRAGPTPPRLRSHGRLSRLAVAVIHTGVEVVALIEVVEKPGAGRPLSMPSLDARDRRTEPRLVGACLPRPRKVWLLAPHPFPGRAGC
jgi:hypothetical protein